MKELSAIVKNWSEFLQFCLSVTDKLCCIATTFYDIEDFNKVFLARMAITLHRIKNRIALFFPKKKIAPKLSPRNTQNIHIHYRITNFDKKLAIFYYLPLFLLFFFFCFVVS